MAPAAKRGRRGPTTRQPLAATPVTPEQTQILPNLIDIFNNSQHVANSESELNKLKKLYKTTDYRQFAPAFNNCLKKLLQSKPQTIYFKTSCEVVCKFLQHVSKLSDEFKSSQTVDTSLENADPKSNKRCTRSSVEQPVSSTTATKTRKRGRKRRVSSSDEEDELLHGLKTRGTDTTMQNDSTTEEDSIILETTSRDRRSIATTNSVATITDHDRFVSSCIDVVDHYMQVASEDCRVNSVFFVSKFLSRIDSLDEEICSALKSTLPQRIRDRKPIIRAHAVIASRTFQENSLTQKAFLHHFYQDPEQIVRKALLQVMDTKVFGYDFLCDSTQDFHEVMKKTAFQRLGKIPPSALSQAQLHRVIHNGLNERDRQVSFAFKTHTLEPWLSSLYDGLDLCKLLESLDILNHHQDVCRLLEMIYEKDLDILENNGTSTKLHRVVETFRDRWLCSDNTCLNLSVVDEKLVTIWLTLVKFCKTNSVIIKHVRVRPVEPHGANDSIEKILDSQQRNDDFAELYERLTPDLVNLVDFIARFVQFTHKNSTDKDMTRSEFIYQQLMLFLGSYEIGDEMERKTVQEVLSTILKENLLTGKFNEFILPVIRCLHTLIYHSSPGLMINYIAELITNVRSHLEDLISSVQPQRVTPLCHSTIVAPAKHQLPRSVKKVRISSQPVSRRSTLAAESHHQNIELRIANIRIELEDLKDEYDEAIKNKDFDQAKLLHNKISDLKAEYTTLHDRRCSMASDISDLTMVVETGQGSENKFSSTMLCDTSMNESLRSDQDEDVTKLVFKHHRNELLKCLQMYVGCLQNVKLNNVPTIMLTHLEHLTYESLANFRDDNQVFCLALACSGLTALVDENYAKTNLSYKHLLISTCLDKTSSYEKKTICFKSLVDIACQHEEIDLGLDKLEMFLVFTLRDYSKYASKDIKRNELDFMAAIIEGAAKLYYFKKICSPKILAHMIIWWYLPQTHSKQKQFIGIFLPTLVVDKSIKPNKRITDTEADEENLTWLQELLKETFILSIEYLHSYILTEAHNKMDKSDMNNLISFLCNLIPVSYHSSIKEQIDETVDKYQGKDMSKEQQDLLKYLKLSKNNLSSTSPTDTPNQPTLERPIQAVD